jgi:hypothetical protein
MFTCCTDKNIVTNVEEPSLIKPEKMEIRLAKMVKNSTTPTKTLLGEALTKKVVSLKGTMLLSDDPTSPDLTPDEIEKIQKNLMLIKEFHEALVNVQDKVLLEVWPILLNKSLGNVDSKTQWQSHILTITSTICGVVSAACAASTVLAPAAAAFGVAAVVIGVTATFVGSEKKSSDITGYDLSSSVGYDVALNTKSFNAMVQMFDYYYDNVNDNRDAVFKMDGKEYNMRDLINIQITKGTVWDNMLILAGRKYRNKKAIELLVKEQFLDLYFIQDSIDLQRDIHRKEIGQPFNSESYRYDVEHGHCYQPCGSPTPPGTQRCRPFNTDYLGKDVPIFSNSEVVHFRGCDNVGASGNSPDNNQDNLVASYLNAIKSFAINFPSCYVYPWSISDQEVLSQRWYIVLGKPKLKDDANKPFYTLADTVFLNWLFIDDGAGNIINPDGVAFRYDVLRSKDILKTDADVYLHAQQISNETAKSEYNRNFNHNGNLICTSWDYRYGPKDIAPYNETNHVYVGDVMNIIVNK